MNFGPLEFGAYLRRKDDLRGGEPATVRAARAAAPTPLPLEGRLTVVSTSSRLAPASWDGTGASRDADEASEL